MKIKLILLIVGLALITLSCKDTVNQLPEKKYFSKENKKKKTLTDSDILFFDFPDTTVIGKLTIGRMKYAKTNNGPDKVEDRYIFLHLYTDDVQQDISLIEMNKIADRFIYHDSIEDGDFTFKALFFNKGINTLHCVVEDIIVIADSGLKENEIKTFTKETIITKQVYVKDTIN